MTSTRATLLIFLIFLMTAVTVQMAASEELIWGKTPWEKKGTDMGEYYIEATDVSLGGSESEIMFGGSRIWVLITIYKNDSVVWRGVFANNTSQTFPDLMDFVYDADKDEYVFTIDVFPPSAPSDHPLYHPDNPAYYPDPHPPNPPSYERLHPPKPPRYERLIEICDNNDRKPVRIIDGTNLIELCVKDLVIGSNPSIQCTVDISTHIIDIQLPQMSFEEWIDNTFAMIKSVSRYVYVRDKAFTEIEISNISLLDRVEMVDPILDEFVVDPDRDLHWNYSQDTYRYSTKPLVPGTYTLPAAKATVWYRGHRINLTSNTPDISVEGPNVTVTKTAELTGDVVNVTVIVINTGEYVTMFYVLDSIPEGAKLIEGVLNYTTLNYTAPNYTEAPRGVLEPGESRYVNKYSIKINNSVVLPRAVAYYQTSKKVDVTREYRPAATFELEKYINPKFYSARARSSEILIRYGTDVEAADNATADAVDGAAADASDEVSDETGESQPVTDGNENDEKGEEEENEEENGLMDKIKAMPGFTSIFAIIGLLSGYLILKFGSRKS